MAMERTGVSAIDAFDALGDDLVARIASYATPKGLANLAMACTRFGGRSINASDFTRRRRSLVEDTAKQMIEETTATEEKSFAGAVYAQTESWTERYSRTEALRRPVTFDVVYEGPPGRLVYEATKFTMKMGTRMKHFIKEYALSHREGIDPARFRYILSSGSSWSPEVEIDPYDTPSSLGIQNVDVIYCSLQPQPLDYDLGDEELLL